MNIDDDFPLQFLGVQLIYLFYPFFLGLSTRYIHQPVPGDGLSCFRLIPKQGDRITLRDSRNELCVWCGYHRRVPSHKQAPK
jgi:hypothetical protein